MTNCFKILCEINKFGILKTSISQRLEWQKIIEKELKDFKPVSKSYKPFIHNVFAYQGDIFAVLEYNPKDSKNIALFLLKNHKLDKLVRKGNNILHIYK